MTTIGATSRWLRSLGKWRHLRNDSHLTMWVPYLRSDDQMEEAIIFQLGNTPFLKFLLNSIFVNSTLSLFQEKFTGSTPSSSIIRLQYFWMTKQISNKVNLKETNKKLYNYLLYSSRRFNTQRGTYIGGRFISNWVPKSIGFGWSQSRLGRQCRSYQDFRGCQ